MEEGVRICVCKQFPFYSTRQLGNFKNNNTALKKKTNKRADHLCNYFHFGPGVLYLYRENFLKALILNEALIPALEQKNNW